MTSFIYFADPGRTGPCTGGNAAAATVAAVVGPTVPCGGIVNGTAFGGNGGGLAPSSSNIDNGCMVPPAST